MRPLLTLLLFVFCFAATAQDSTATDTSVHSLYKPIDVPNTDSLISHMQHKLDSESMERMNTKSINAYSSIMEESNKKQKQQMWLRLSMGIGFLIIGIIGFARKRKKTPPAQNQK